MSCSINTVTTRPYDLFKSVLTTTINGKLYVGTVSTSATLSMSGDTVIVQTGVFSGVSSGSTTVKFVDNNNNTLMSISMTISGVSSSDNVIMTIKLQYSKA